MSSGVLFFFGFFLPYVVVPWAERRLMLSLPTEAKMKKHLIICGYVIDSLLAIKDFNVRKYVVHGDQRYTRYFLFAGAKKVFLPKNLVATTIARSIQGEIKIGRLEQKS